MGNTASVVASVGVPLVLGQVMGLISAPDVLNWYPTLKKVRGRAGKGARNSGL
jgi:hypothetical protein